MQLKVVNKVKNLKSRFIALKKNKIKNLKSRFIILKKNKYSNTNTYWLWNLNKINLKKKIWSVKIFKNGLKNLKIKNKNCNKIKKSFKLFNLKSNIYKNIIENNTNTSYKIPKQSWKYNLWINGVKNYCNSKELLDLDEYSDEDCIKTVRNTTFKLPIGLSFKGLVKYIDLPIDFGLKKFEILRYNSHFYGYNYQANLFNYNLWLTMGLKKNISVPFNLYYNTNNTRKDFLAYINNVSWKNYAYLIKNSFIKKKFDIFLDNINLTLYTDYLSDISIWNCRKKFNFHRSLSLIHDDFDYSVSTYHNQFYYYDYRARSQFFFIANNSNLRDTTFYITSFDISVLLLPRKYLKSISILSKITKFHRSWNFISNNEYENKLIINKTLLCLWQNFLIKYYKIKLNLFINDNKLLFSFFKLLLLKCVHLLNLKHSLNLKFNYLLKSFFLRFIFLLSFPNKNYMFNLTINKYIVKLNDSSIYNSKIMKLYVKSFRLIYIWLLRCGYKLRDYKKKKFYTKKFRYQFRKLLKKYWNVNNLRGNYLLLKYGRYLKYVMKYNKFISKKCLNYYISFFMKFLSKKFIQFLFLNKKKNLILNFLNLNFKNNIKFKINRLTNIYFRSHGFFKFSIKRSLVFKKGFIKLQSLGIKHSLQIISRAQFLYNKKFYYWNFLNIPEKASMVKLFTQRVFKFLFCFIQNSFNLNLNFLNLNLIEDFNLQLYVFLYNFFEFSDSVISLSYKNLYFKNFYKHKYNYKNFFFIKKKIFNKCKKLSRVDNLNSYIFGSIDYLNKNKIYVSR